MAVVLFSLRTGTDDITAYSGLYQKDPFLTLVLSICLLSLAGLPPGFAGFVGKVYLFWAAIQAEAYTLVFFGLVTSVASIYYYVRVIKLMLVKEPSPEVLRYSNADQVGILPLRAGMAITSFATLVLIFFYQPLIDLANISVRATPSMRPLPTAVRTPLPSAPVSNGR